MQLAQLMPRARRREPIARPDPFTALQRHINQLFEELPAGFDDLLDEAPTWTTLRPRVDMTTDDEKVYVTMELPGVAKDDIEVTLPSNNAIVVRGEKKAEKREKKDGEVHTERVFGSFYRALPLPCQVDPDHIKAKFKHGLLKIELPRVKQPEQLTPRIPIDD